MARGVEIGRGYIAVDTDDSEARDRLKSFGVFAAKAFAVAAAGAGLVVAGAAAIGVQFNSMKEQAEVAFTTLLGSGEAARSMLADLQKFAAQTPFEMEGLIDNARQLLGVGVAADKVIPTLTALGNTAGALGINQEAFNRILLATTQAMGKGKLQGEELMQMVENGIPVWQLLSKALGKPVGDLQKLASDGKLLSNEVLPLLFDQMQKDYGGAMAAQAKTLAGTWSSLTDNAKILTGTAFKPLFNLTKELVGSFGELAGSDEGTAFAERFADGLQLAIDKTKAFVNATRLSFGGDYADTLDIAKQRAKDYFTAFKDLATNAFDGTVTVVRRALPQINAFFDAMGMAVEPALRAVSSVSESFARNADGIGRALSTALGVVNSVAGPALGLLGNLITAAATALSALLDLVNSAPGFFGTLAGVLATGVIAWRLLGGSITDVSKVLTFFSSSGAAAGGLQKIASKVEEAALSAGVLTEKLTGSAKATNKVVDGGIAIGSAFRGLAGLLPALGGALLATGGILGTYLIQQNAIKDAAEGMARGLSEGGQKAREAAGQLGSLKGQLAEVERQQNAWNSSMEATQAGADDVFGGQLGDKAMDLRNRIGEVDAQFRDLTANMGPVEAAQAKYNRAVAEYGSDSAEASAASMAWRSALADEKLKNEQAAQATKTHLDRLLELQAAQLGMLNTDIGYRQSLSNLESAHARVADAVARSGEGSKEHRDALLQEEQAFVGVIDAAGRRAAAQVASQGPEAQAKAAMEAQNQEALRLIATLGTAAPQSLKTFVANMDAASLAALDATKRTGNFNRVVIELSPGKTVTLAVDPQTGKVIDFSNAVNAVVNRKDVHLNVVVTSSGDVRALDALGRPVGLTARAIGGQAPSGGLLVGERGPEILFQDRSSYVATASQTRSLLNDMGDTGGTPPIQQNIYASPGMSERNVADLAAAGIAWRTRYQ